MTATGLCDAHLHLQDPALGPADEAIAQAATEGVGVFVVNATRPSDWQAVLDLAADPRVVPCLGLHPWHASEAGADWPQRLEDLLHRSARAGVGEIGLDRWVEPRDEAAQEQAFRLQMGLAARLRRPAMVHCLRAWGWLMDVLDDLPALPEAMLIHAYGGPSELIAPLAERGAWFSLAGNILEPRRTRQREAARQIPLDRLLIETDAPDMAPPAAFRRAGGESGPNSPANLPAIALGIAELLGLPAEELAAITWRNSRAVLGALWPAEGS